MQISTSQSSSPAGGSGMKAQAEQLVQAALNLRVQAAEQNTIKAPPPSGKGGKINTVA